MEDAKEIENLSNEIANCWPGGCPPGKMCLGGSCIYPRPRNGGLQLVNPVGGAPNVKPLGIQDVGGDIDIHHNYKTIATEDAKEIENLSNEIANCWTGGCPPGKICLGGSCGYPRPANGVLDQDARNVKPLGVQDSGIGIELSHRYMDIAKEDAKEIEKLSNEVAVCLHDCPPGSFCLVNQCIFHRPADVGLDQDARNVKPLGVQDSGIGIEITHRYMDIAKDDAEEIEKLSNEVAVCLHECPPGSFCLVNQCIFHRPADGG